MEVLIKLGIILVVGFAGGKLAGLVKLPSVSGYLVVGLLLGPSLFNMVNSQDVESFEILSEIALSIIAFSIGSEFVIKDMMKYGKRIFWITLFEVIGAVFVVFAVMYFIFNQPFAFSIVIASMSAATAPAATLMVIRQYRANGPLTRTVLPVVALDDVFGIMAFGLALSLAKLSISPEAVTVGEIFLTPLIEIGGSLLLGALLGFILAFASRLAKSRDENQILTLAFIGIATGVAKWLGLSPLLANIMMGTVLVNLIRTPLRIFTSVNDFASPFFVLFFTIAGASLDLSILATVGIVGVAYVFARAGGKILGTWFGARVTNSDKKVQKYMGFAMLPQGGISIGLSVIVRQELPLYAVAITTIIMFSVLIYETSGPIFAKLAIKGAGEINGVDTYFPESNIEAKTAKVAKKSRKTLQQSAE
ncbi:MAG: cation:proton antiporter [Tenericutes bacterium HGW-Tenericutes-1]|jgi:Kef-type K+ transport system membrane component KefB|nr:MAG: cation:proton antiporter [Tenericutes bacterium HGW-Tenericutes-1]